MTINTIALGGHNLPQCQVFSVRVDYLGGATTLADGSLRRDLMDTACRHRWTLTWVSLTGTEIGNILHAFDGAVAGDVAFTAPDGTGYTVNAGEKPTLSWDAYKVAGAGGVLRYRASMELAEV